METIEAAHTEVDDFASKPVYIRKILRDRLYNSKYKEYTPEERMKLYAIKRDEWRTKNKDRVACYGKEFCEFCQRSYENIYKHNTSKKHLVNADKYVSNTETVQIPKPVKQQDVMSDVLLRHLEKQK